MKKNFITISAVLFPLLLVGCDSGTNNTSASQADPNCVQLVEEAKKRHTQNDITDPMNTGLRFLDDAIVGCSSLDVLIASSQGIEELLPGNTNIKLFIVSRCTTAEKPEVKSSQICTESTQGLLNLS